jgi:hypothetical protein
MSIKVRLGEYDFTRFSETRAQDFQIVDIQKHPDFSFSTYENDIAILKLHRRVAFNSYIWPVCLPPPGPDFENVTAIVAGKRARAAVPSPNQDVCHRDFPEMSLVQTPCSILLDHCRQSSMNF